MASPFSLPSKKKAVGSDEYQKLLDRELKRHKGDRDKAVRAANVAGGFGNSTAQQKFSDKKAAPKVKAAAPAEKKSSPELPATAPVPTPRQTQLPPDLAVSPMRPGENQIDPSAPTLGGGGLQPVTMPPMPSRFPDTVPLPPERPLMLPDTVPLPPERPLMLPDTVPLPPERPSPFPETMQPPPPRPPTPRKSSSILTQPLPRKLRGQFGLT